MEMRIKLSAFHFNCVVILVSTFFTTHTSSSGVQLDSNNIDGILEHNELVFVNFYADWCRFSQMLAPIFEETAKKIKSEFPQAGKVVLGKVDCDRETQIAARYHVSKYPTLKMFRYGQMVKREFRGQRSAEAISKFVREQLQDNIQRVTNLDDLDNIDRKKRNIIGYFDGEDNEEFRTFAKVATMLRDDCQFYAAVGEVAMPERIAGNKIVYRPTNVDLSDLPYTNPIADYTILSQWTTDKCVPLVREITFENAEELTEEGLPFLILFHNPDDTETPEKFRKQVALELITEKNSINCLVADGNKFSHPLYHLGKSAKDLPILAIDSFRHMYLWSHNPKTDLEKPGLLKQFIADLHSGKLHREFHHGPDKATKAPNQEQAALGPVATGHNGHHVDVQQQVIISKNGMAVQVVKIVQTGHQRDMNFKQIAEKVDEHEKKEEEQEKKEEEIKKEEEKMDEELGITKDDKEQIKDDDKNKDDENKDGEHKDEGGEEKVDEGTKQIVEKLVEEVVPDNKIKVDNVKIDDEKIVVEETKKIKVKEEKETSEVPMTTTPKPPPDSMFRHLFPSRHRYTFARDEL